MFTVALKIYFKCTAGIVVQKTIDESFEIWTHTDKLGRSSTELLVEGAKKILRLQRNISR